MWNNKTLTLAIVAICSLCASAQDGALLLNWQHLHDGLDYCETNAPEKSIVNDSKISILKINPDRFEFRMLSGSENGDSTRTAPQWAKDFKMDVVINAGMYDLGKTLSNKAYLQNYQHFNNPNFNPNFGAMIAFNPKDSLLPNFKIADLSCYKWDSLKTKYNSFSQGMRMLDCNGKALTWNKRNQSCSMLLAAADNDGNIYFIFSRSPYSHNDMICFLLQMPVSLENAIYLEGGPETSMYIHAGDTTIEKVGSYISGSYPNDDNKSFWKLPNVIGLRHK
jgi:hypothetical protein